MKKLSIVLFTLVSSLCLFGDKIAMLDITATNTTCDTISRFGKVAQAKHLVVIDSQLANTIKVSIGKSATVNEYYDSYYTNVLSNYDVYGTKIKGRFFRIWKNQTNEVMRYVKTEGGYEYYSIAHLRYKIPTDWTLVGYEEAEYQGRSVTASKYMTGSIFTKVVLQNYSDRSFEIVKGTITNLLMKLVYNSVELTNDIVQVSGGGIYEDVTLETAPRLKKVGNTYVIDRIQEDGFYMAKTKSDTYNDYYSCGDDEIAVSKSWQSDTEEESGYFTNEYGTVEWCFPYRTYAYLYRHRVNKNYETENLGCAMYTLVKFQGATSGNSYTNFYKTNFFQYNTGCYTNLTRETAPVITPIESTYNSDVMDTKVRPIEFVKQLSRKKLITREYEVCNTNYVNGILEYAFGDNVYLLTDYYIHCENPGITNGTTSIKLIYEK